MELRAYQKTVLNDLRRFLFLLSETQSIRKAYNTLWEEKGVSIGESGMPPYHMVLQSVPHVCLKVPTGGGKTYLAANSIKPIFDSMPCTRPRAVVWLVPSDAILKQTANNLTNRAHPYRQRIDVDFSGNVEIYTKDQLLNGQNFNISSVNDNLSVFILSYDSFRANNKEGRKAYQQNGYLNSFKTLQKDKSILLPDIDETALIQVIRSLNPVVIVDESHHATSKLSIEMLENFNPCFILDLTATPKDGSNIISFVNARHLKNEGMVKLPVIVYNQKSQEDVFLSAISLRNRLEVEAVKNKEETGRYIRPIVLLQAETNTSDNSTTYEKIKKILINIGVPGEQIAIKTGEKDDIKNVDLLSENCKIRFIITVNALREGWDCPFAYILATVANRSSVVDVEQILGRTLRLPYAKESKNHQSLNLSYVITSSADFYGTLDKVVDGLNHAGFSKKDYRAKNMEDVSPIKSDNPFQMSLDDFMSEDKNAENSNSGGLPSENAVVANTEKMSEGFDDSTNQEWSNGVQEADKKSDGVFDDMMDMAMRENAAYCEDMESKTDEHFADIPDEVKDKMKAYHVKEEFKEDIRKLKLPQFVIEEQYGFFSLQRYELVDRESLRKGFTLSDKDTKIDFNSIDAEIAKIDAGEDGESPKAWKLRGFESEIAKEWFDSRPTESKRRHCIDKICTKLSKINALHDGEIREYVGRIISHMTAAQLTELEQMPDLYAEKVKKKVDSLLAEHEAEVFHKWLAQDYIKCLPMYELAETITPIKTISSIPKSLYEEEDGNLNPYERKVIWELSALDNVRWWHRNAARKEFAINGAVTAYPDFMVMLENGKMLMLETKGDFLKNDEAEAKSKTGAEWAGLAGAMYKYFMVFETKRSGYAGSCSYDEFMDIMRGMRL